MPRGPPPRSGPCQPAEPADRARAKSRAARDRRPHPAEPAGRRGRAHARAQPATHRARRRAQRGTQRGHAGRSPARAPAMPGRPRRAQPSPSRPAASSVCPPGRAHARRLDSTRARVIGSTPAVRPTPTQSPGDARRRTASGARVPRPFTNTRDERRRDGEMRGLPMLRTRGRGLPRRGRPLPVRRVRRAPAERRDVQYLRAVHARGPAAIR